MFDSIFDDLKNYFRSGNMISRIIIINGAVFLALILIKIGLIFTGPEYAAKMAVVTKYISINESMWFNITHPWVFVTHAFTHFGFFHILFNMLMLLWFGRIVGDLLGDKHVLPIYIYGIMAGILFFWISANYISPGTQIAYGASAAVMAIVVAAGFTAPDYEMNLILIGPVRIKYIVLVLLILDLLSVSNMSNTGGHLAHLGGAILGGLYVNGLRSGYDLSTPMNNLINKIVAIFTPSERSAPRRKSPLTVSFKSEGKTRKSGSISDTEEKQYSVSDRLDEILDKIKEKGIQRLTKEEREFLENQSKN
ncbi:rhomboid family intramembrane serine protease [Portibacter lacus]|uniref:Rhomboid family intramembrane serine protease n=1 Tax=Portibacter lacus TaxID=1099794 RepID=A0AA37SQP3_9BACT|nr:rhomboid family intramembrane serine protease [Portibacter lacus]GLR17914.1 rhomboid family intramembrane serine protease [Portibacter lacus]